MDYFLLVGEQTHSSPLYTQTRTSTAAEEATRAYGQDQINKRYGVRSKATVDPFLAMPAYSERFARPERTLPDLTAQPFSEFDSARSGGGRST